MSAQLAAAPHAPPSGATLEGGLASLGLAVAGETQARLLQYLTLIEKWNRVYNLTAIRDLQEMVSTHLLDSLAVVAPLSGYVSAYSGAALTLLDVGSGAGLPGIPLALIWPQARVTLIDSNQKKCSFLQQAVIELALNHVSVVCARVETWNTDQRYDLVITRAFANLADFVRDAGGRCAPHGVLAAMKGVYPQDELDALAAAQTPYAPAAVLPLQVPGLHAARHLVVLKSNETHARAAAAHRGRP